MVLLCLNLVAFLFHNYSNIFSQKYTIMTNASVTLFILLIILSCNNPEEVKKNAQVTVKQTTFTLAIDQTELTLEFENSGEQDLSWKINEDLAWLEITPSNGVLKGGEKQSLKVTIDRSQLQDIELPKAIFDIDGSNAGKVGITITIEKGKPKLSLSVGELDFGNADSKKSFVIDNGGAGKLEWSLTENLAWLSVDPTSGVDKKTITVTIDRSSLSGGSGVSGNINIKSNGGDTIINVKAAKSKLPMLSVSPDSLDFEMSSNLKSFKIANNGEEALNWTITESLPWLSVSSNSGTNGATINVTVDRSGLSAGSNVSGNITIRSNGGDITVNVKASKSSNPMLHVNPDSLDFGMSSNLKTLTIMNNGGGNLNWTIVESLPWLSVNSNSGTNGATINLTVDRSGLSPASEVSGNININSNGGNKTIFVKAAKEGIPVLSVSASTIDFKHYITKLTFNISNTGSGTLNWTITESLSWLSVDTTNGSNARTITVKVDRNDIAPGKSEADSIIISSNGGKAVVKVNISVKPFTIKVTVEPPSAEDLKFLTDGGFTINQDRIKKIAEEQTKFWNDLIKGYHPDVLRADLVRKVLPEEYNITIKYSIRLQFTLGEATPSSRRMVVESADIISNTFPSGGSVTINAQLSGRSDIDKVIRHEMGHALGFGLNFENVENPFVTPKIPAYTLLNGSDDYVGKFGLAAYRKEFVGQSGATYVPMTAHDEAGHIGCHVESSCSERNIQRSDGFKIIDDLMSPDVAGRGDISETTKAIMRDLGWVIKK